MPSTSSTQLLDALERGEVRAARARRRRHVERRALGEARHPARLSRSARVVDMSVGSGAAADASGSSTSTPIPPRALTLSDGVRVVPGGSSIRRGAYVAPGVVCMPPMYVNVGAWVGAGHDGRLARARRLVRADRRARAPERRGADRRRARAGERRAGRHRGRRRSSAATAACTKARSCARAPCSPPASCSRAARRCSISCNETRLSRRRPSARSRFPTGAVVVPGARAVASGWGARAGTVAADAGHREVPRREDGPRDRAGGMAAMTATGSRVARRVRVPGDKSISHRALICGALADGTSRVRAILPVGRRALDRRRAARVRRRRPARSATTMRVDGRGLARSARARRRDLDCGNSGTSTRLMAGVVAGIPFAATFIGDASLSRRPMRARRHAARRDGRDGSSSTGARRLADDGARRRRCATSSGEPDGAARR